MADKPTALLTGASSGIGLGIARKLLQQGYRVVGISRRGQVAELQREDFIPVSLDLSCDRGCRRHAPAIARTTSLRLFCTRRRTGSLRLHGAVFHRPYRQFDSPEPDQRAAAESRSVAGVSPPGPGSDDFYRLRVGTAGRPQGGALQRGQGSVCAVFARHCARIARPTVFASA